jgi:GAF domain-containing protein/anti-sigma regulatory factor (Ser/Thr protein kinase)
MLENAVRICGASFGNLLLYDGEKFRHVALHNAPQAWVAEQEREPVPPRDLARVLYSIPDAKRVVHIGDLTAVNPNEPIATIAGARTLLIVPMLKQDGLVGVIAVYRQEVRPFTDKQVELVSNFARQAVIAIENVRLLNELRQRTTDLTESLEQQTATADVLKVISRSALDLQRVLDALVVSAARLCNANDAAIFQLFGDGLRLVAHHGQIPLGGPVGQYTVPLVRGRIYARAVIDRKATQVADLLAEADEYPESWKVAVQVGWRTALCVPLLHAGEAIGVIFIRRTEVRPFTERQIELVNTFADQAVIAIENTRLFEAEQASKRELQESLEYQTATSEVLQVISRSPGHLQPVYDTMLGKALQHCDAKFGGLFRYEEGVFRGVSGIGVPEGHVYGVDQRALDPTANSDLRNLVTNRQPIHSADLRQSASYLAGDPFIVGAVERGGARAALIVPLIKENTLIGVFAIYRQEVRSFTDKQIQLLENFAGQAVIAIENTRLFEEVQARNHELRTALEQQTATSELLKVIGRSTFELQPVFDTLAENAVRLCAAERAFVHRFDGQFLRVAATYNVSPELSGFIERNPMAPGRYGVAARAALERRSVHIRDVQADPEITFAAREIEPVRTALSVPMLRSEELLGVIMIYRHEMSPFTDSQVALIETFADQAAIAIENSRLLEELQARNSDLTALGEVGRAVSSTLDLKVVLKTIVDRAVELSGTDGGSIFYFREDIGRFQLGETTELDEEAVARVRELDIVAGQTGLGEAIATREPLQMPDLLERPRNPLRDAAIAAGFRAALIVPLLSGDGPLGALVLQRRRPGKFAPAVVSLMQSFADQSAIALENARLFEEIAKKSRELEIASQHKSQFVANMSHELRTPLAAILGYAELIQEGFYEPQGPKSIDALSRIRSNGKHLLGLINTVLDIAKIESGQFTLNMTEYAIEGVVETVRSATESLAQNKKLALKTEVAKSLPVGLGDEQRLTQVLLNLVGNAIKFTDTGEVRVTAKAVNGHFNVSVTDTGPGIPEEHQARIFEQFHQVDSSNTKAKGGTGLGLAIAKQIVEMHGGRIWVESTLGKGSTFQMELPTRAEVRKLVP